MTEYPKDDTEFSDLTITAVEKGKEGWFVTRNDGWSNYIERTCPVVPRVGMPMRMYGRGTAFRGIYLDGQKVFYRTATEDDEYREIQLYGADAMDWLRRWDADKAVWSISMGGLGPGYEQCIQITAAEIVRWLLEHKPETADMQNKEKWPAIRDQLEKATFENPTIKELGLSGAQWGAAMSLGTSIYMRGPREIMKDEQVKDRHIQVQRSFPKAA